MAPLAGHTESVMALIPAYNEEGAIRQVIEGVRAVMPQVDVVVIDDCSTDRTAAVAAAAGAAVVRIPSNLGIGGAVQTGLKYARQYGYDVVIRLDGDGQHNPQEIPVLYGALQSGRADVVVGSRFAGTDADMSIPMSRRIGIKTFAFLVSALTRSRVTDTTSGFMCMNRRAILVLADYLPQDYPEVEGRVILHKAGLSTIELPAHMRARLSGISSINSWRSIYYAFKVSVAVLICALKDIPRVQKELKDDVYTLHPASRRYRGQRYSVAGDRATDSEAQAT